MNFYLVPPDIGIIREVIQRFDPTPYILLSFVRVGQDFGHFLYTYRSKLGKIMIDSGAYSEMQGTLSVDLDTYLAYVEPCGHLFDYCVNLDVEPQNYDVRMWNLAKLKRVCSNVLPVVHDPYAGEIDQLYDMGHHYILLGSTWGNDRKQLDFIFNRYVYSGRFPNIRFHKLGTTTYVGLCEYPYYSCDSAAFIKVGGFGNIFFWNENREPDDNGDCTDLIYFGGRDLPESKRCPIYYNYRHIGQLEDYLWKVFEYRISDIEGSPGATGRWIVNAKYMLDLQERITRLHQNR